MAETKFMVNGVIVSKEQAKRHWLDSDVYADAATYTRKHIWPIAINGDAHGNHNPQGEVDHLAKAGIVLF